MANIDHSSQWRSSCQLILLCQHPVLRDLSNGVSSAIKLCFEALFQYLGIENGQIHPAKLALKSTTIVTPLTEVRVLSTKRDAWLKINRNLGRTETWVSCSFAVASNNLLFVPEQALSNVAPAKAMEAPLHTGTTARYGDD